MDCSAKYVLSLFPPSLRYFRLGGIELWDFQNWIFWTGFLLDLSNIQEFLYACILKKHTSPYVILTRDSVTS